MIWTCTSSDEGGRGGGTIIMSEIGGLVRTTTLSGLPKGRMFS